MLGARGAHREKWLRALEHLEQAVPAQIHALQAAAEAQKESKALATTEGDEHLSPKQIRELAGRYEYADDAAPREAGECARKRGYYRREEFLEVVRWKAARTVPRAERNDAETIEAATGAALTAKGELERIVALLTLEGVGVPVASALLAFAYPEEYPILDFRALETLGRKTGRTQYGPEYWLDYLTLCRRLAKDAGVSIRDLDKALWQASKEASSK